MSATRKGSQSPKKRKPEDGAVADSIVVDDAIICKQTKMRDKLNTPSSTSNSQICSVSGVNTESSLLSPTPKRSRRQDVSPCPILSSSISVHSHSGHSENLSKKGPDISCLAQRWLENERQRSGVEQMWTEDSRWLREVWAGKSLASHEIPRWLSLSGYDVRDTEFEDE